MRICFCGSFSKIESVSVALEFLQDPVGYFDNIITAVTGMRKPGLKTDGEMVCRMYGIERPAFIEAVKGVRLASAMKKLFTWEEARFVVNQAAVDELMEQFKTYAITQPQVEIVDHWERLAGILNEHYQRKYMDQFTSNTVADALGRTKLYY